MKGERSGKAKTKFSCLMDTENAVRPVKRPPKTPAAAHPGKQIPFLFSPEKCEKHQPFT